MFGTFSRCGVVDCMSITIMILLHHLHFGVVSSSNIDFICFTTEFSDTQFLLKDDVDF